MKLYEELVKSNTKSAAVDIILDGDNYLMIPRGRSIDSSWFGLKYLDYIVTGDKQELMDIDFIEKVLGAIDVSINYDIKHIDKNDKINDIVSNFILKSNGVNRISINLDLKRPNTIIIYKFTQSIKNEFSATLNDALIIDDNSSKKDFSMAIVSQLGLNHTNNRK